MEEDAIHHFEGNVTLIAFTEGKESNEALCPLKRHVRQTNDDEDEVLLNLPVLYPVQEPCFALNLADLFTWKQRQAHL